MKLCFASALGHKQLLSWATSAHDAEQLHVKVAEGGLCRFCFIRGAGTGCRPTSWNSSSERYASLRVRSTVSGRLLLDFRSAYGNLQGINQSFNVQAK